MFLMKWILILFPFRGGKAKDLDEYHKRTRNNTRSDRDRLSLYTANNSDKSDNACYCHKNTECRRCHSRDQLTYKLAKQLQRISSFAAALVVRIKTVNSYRTAIAFIIFIVTSSVHKFPPHLCTYFQIIRKRPVPHPLCGYFKSRIFPLLVFCDAIITHLSTFVNTFLSNSEKIYFFLFTKRKSCGIMIP